MVVGDKNLEIELDVNSIRKVEPRVYRRVLLKETKKYLTNCRIMKGLPMAIWIIPINGADELIIDRFKREVNPDDIDNVQVYKHNYVKKRLFNTWEYVGVD